VVDSVHPANNDNYISIRSVRASASSPNVNTRGSRISPMTSHDRRLVLAECVIGCACVSDAARRDSGTPDREGGS